MDEQAKPASHGERYVTSAFNRRQGYRFEPRERGVGEVRLDPAEKHVQVEGVLHGGVLSTLADTAGVYAIYPDLDEDCSMTSIEFKLNFLRPATLSRGTLTARAHALKVGRSIATADVEVRQAGELVAKGLFTYLVMR